MQFVVWLVACGAAAFMLRRSPTAIAATVLVLWVLIPGVASHVVTGIPATSSIGFHPASWFAVMAVGMLAITRPRALSFELGRHFWYYLILALVSVEVVVLTRNGEDPAGLVTVVDEVIVPILLFLVVNAALTTDDGASRTLRTTLIGVTAFECVFACVQFAAHSVIVFESSYLTQYWFHPATWSRWMGTTDHPLNLSLLICAATPFLAGMKRPGWTIPLLALFGVGTLITQSRTGTIAFVIGALYVLWRVALPRWSKVTTIGIALVSAAVVLPATALGAGILSRIANDTGSSDARASAVQFFSTQWQQYVASGDGLTAGYLVAARGGLITSFESSVVMYAVGIGILATAFYFGVQVVIVARNAWWQSRNRGLLVAPGALLSGVVMLILPQTYSALASPVLAGALLWFVMALVSRPEVDAVVRPDDEDETDTEDESTEDLVSAW